MFRDDNLTLVNKTYKLDKDYEPDDLVTVNSNYVTHGNVTMRAEAYRAFEQMRETAKAEGLTLNISTAYRSYSTQKRLYTGYLNSSSQKVVDTFSARPGHSEHQLGVAADFAAGQKRLENFTGTPEQKWMQENAYKFGFILRYLPDKVDITGYKYESWHYRYVGNIAEKIKNSGLCLEEYLELN